MNASDRRRKGGSLPWCRSAPVAGFDGQRAGHPPGRQQQWAAQGKSLDVTRLLRRCLRNSDSARGSGRSNGAGFEVVCRDRVAFSISIECRPVPLFQHDDAATTSRTGRHQEGGSPVAIGDSPSLVSRS